MKRRNKVSNILFLCIVLILVLVMIYSGLQLLGPTIFNNEEAPEETFVSKTITRNGVDYFPRQDITVVMVLGIDQLSVVEDSGSYNNSGASDVVMLMIFDEADQTSSILVLNRDTMVEMPVLGIGGKPAGTLYGQLALSHTYGSGLEDSCENTRTTVSNLLNGINIDYYVSLNMGAIPIINDAVGGVPVTVTDDFSAVDPTITKGEVLLQGEQALNYIRTRQGLGDQLNLSRMERHEEYMNGFLDALRAKLEQDPNFIVELYEEVAPYMVTDCSVNTISGMMERYVDYSIKEIVSPEGENVLGEKYYEFYADAEKLDELAVRLFYAEK